MRARAEIAHVDLIIRDKDGLAGVGLYFGLVHQSYGHTKLFAASMPLDAQSLGQARHAHSPQGHYKEHVTG